MNASRAHAQRVRQELRSAKVVVMRLEDQGQASIDHCLEEIETRHNSNNREGKQEIRHEALKRNTHPPYSMIRSEASSRVRLSRVPVITNLAPFRQKGLPTGGGTIPWFGGSAGCFSHAGGFRAGEGTAKEVPEEAAAEEVGGLVGVAGFFAALASFEGLMSSSSTKSWSSSNSILVLPEEVFLGLSLPAGVFFSPRGVRSKSPS